MSDASDELATGDCLRVIEDGENNTSVAAALLHMLRDQILDELSPESDPLALSK